MAGRAVEVVRKPLSARPHTRRTLTERLAIRFPGLVAPVFRVMGRLSPSSRLRQAILWRGAQQGVEAFNRRDLDAVVIAYQPDIEYHPYREFVEAGLSEACYRGHSGYRAYVDGTNDVWGDEVRLEPTELIDLGDRLVILANMPMRAQGSGIALGETYAGVSTLRDGKIVRQDDYLSHAEALRAVGLPA